jgi:hypothetical protein
VAAETARLIMMSDTPPRWAEIALRLLLTPEDGETVSGDLLEHYREHVRPTRGWLRADLWYLRQVAGFAWRTNGLWAVLWGAAFLVRTAFDWLLPTTDFQLRSTISTILSFAILISAGSWAAWRTRSVAAGPMAAVITLLIGEVITSVGAIVLLVIWHDPATFAAIDSSGGLSEVFTLPLVLLAPAAVVGALGGLFGSAARRYAR